jgi:hypothetical protein
LKHTGLTLFACSTAETIDFRTCGGDFSRLLLKTVLINFMYERCGGICPGVTTNLKKVQKEFAIGRDIFMYSITLEPEYDTSSVLEAYAELFKVKPGWKFLTGKKMTSNCCADRWGTCQALGVIPNISPNIFIGWSLTDGDRNRRKCCVKSILGRDNSATDGMALSWP